jgi:hypothetical protein
MKFDGVLEARNSCDDSVLKGYCATYVQHYITCISQPGMRLLWAMVAIRGWVTMGADADNTFAQSAPPKEPRFVRIYD